MSIYIYVILASFMRGVDFNLVGLFFSHFNDKLLRIMPYLHLYFTWQKKHCTGRLYVSGFLFCHIIIKETKIADVGTKAVSQEADF